MKSSFVGTIKTTAKGVGFINNETAPYPEDIMVEAGFLNTALNQDVVEVQLNAKIPGERQTARVVRIAERKKTHFVGTLEIERGLGYVVADDKHVYKDFFIPKDALGGAKHGDKVQIELTSWPDPKKNPDARIVRVIGTKGVHNVEMEAIVLDRGFDTRFPPAVERDAEEIEKHKAITPEEVKKRRDFRGTLTMTIDPFDAKDFDDAISFKQLSGDNFEIGVHIADVSHYVIEGTALDIEALRRGSSIYLVDRTIPMLPEVLSNDVCSLNPHEDKLTFSAVFVMNMKGDVLERWFGKTVINSTKRFTYENAQEVLNAKSGEYYAELNILNTIAKKLQAEKYKNGAIEFDTEEIKFKLDENGKPIGVYKKERLDTHKLVEEYMLLANREVAKYIYDCIEKKNISHTGSIYRIHDAPDTERIGDLGTFIRALGHHFPKDKVTAKDISKMLRDIDGTPEADMIKTATVRSMQKAIYSTQNIGHFGLAFEYYTHFTSPIRRYPDLLVQRILENHLTVNKFNATDVAKFARIAAQSTEREIAAAEAERASKKYKQVEYMSERVGHEFAGIISGVSEWGIYIEEAETKSEGMVKLRDLGSDFYTLDKKTYSVTGQKSKQVFRLGDKVRFKVMAADMEKRTLDYKLV